MPIEVVDSDGTVIEFPDGTPNATITSVMRRRDQDRQARARGVDAGGRARAPATPAPVSRRGQSAPLMQEIEGGLAALNRGLPFANDVSSAGAGLLSMAQGGSFGEGFQRQRQRTLDVANDFTARRPNVSNLATGTGMALPMLATMGATIAPQTTGAAARGLGGFARQTGEAATIGAGFGAAYGAGRPELTGAGWQERLGAANEGLALGGALGAAAPAAVNVARAGARPLTSALSRVIDTMPVPRPNTVGAMGGNLQAPPPRRPAGLRPNVARAVDRLADRSQQGAAQVEQRLAGARANPQGQVLADVFDTPGVQTVRSMTQFPGRTGQRAADAARERFQAAPDRILADLNRRLRVAETPEQAMRALRSQYDEVSAQNYQPVFAQQLGAEQRQALENALAPFLDDPVMRDAVQRAERIFNRQRALGLMSGQIDDNFARYVHLLKMGLDDAVAGAPVGSRGLQATEMRDVYAMRARILNAIDNNVPGYAQARARWGGLVEAEEALTEGAAMIRQGHGSIQERMGQMTPFAQYHARVGFANELANRLGLRGSVNGNRNVAEALGSPEMQRRVAAMFETPEEAAAFLDTLNTQNMLMRNAAGWQGGSSTAANLAFQEDNLAGALADAAGHAATGRPGTAVAGLWGQARNALSMGAVERHNNEVGAALLRRIDDAEAKEFADAVVAELRRREAARNAAARTARGAGAAGGAQGGRQ